MLPRSFGALNRAAADRGELRSTAAPFRWLRRSLSTAAFAAPLLLVAQSLTSCGDDSGGGDTVCEPGGPAISCNCAGNQMGEQLCREDGSGYQACDCSGNGGDGGSAGSAGSGSMAGSAGTGAEPEPIFDIGLIGAPCEAAADCSDAVPNFTCIPSSSDVEFGGGGPEGGYCTVPCQTSDDCVALDGASGCGLRDTATGEGYCIALCLAGNNPNGKCGAGEYRAQACVQNPQDPRIGACFPMCTSDEGCGEGRFCALEPNTAGLCVSTAPTGGGVGAACTPETQDTDCASGICLTFSDDAGEVVGGFCSANCTYGYAFGCGYAPGTPETTPRENFCLQEQLAGGGPGDLGFCFEVCDEDTDCIQDDWVCDAFGDPDLQAFIGRQGQCIPAVLTNDGAADAGPG